MKVKNTRFSPRLSMAMLLMLFGIAAQAWDGSVSGTVANFQVVVGQSGNFELRVELTGASVLCAGGSSWAYANSNELNYQTLVAAIMMAKSTGATVVLYTNRDASNYCHIGHVVVS